MKIRTLFGIETERESWGPDEWAYARAEVPTGYEELLLVIASGTVGNVRFIHAVRFAEYRPDEGFVVDVDADEGFVVDVDADGERLEVEFWRPIPELPEEIKAEIEELEKEVGYE